MSNKKGIPNKINRRQFMGGASCAALGTTGLFSTLVSLQKTNTALASSSRIDGYKALVCVFLAGGNDSFNMLVPGSTSSEHSVYREVRGENVGLPTSQISDLNGTHQGGRKFGVHHKMKEVQKIFNDSDTSCPLSFVANVGTLIEPIANSSEYNSLSKMIPSNLFSHSDQIMQWQQGSIPMNRTDVTGWTGRLQDKLMSGLSSKVSMNISLSGNNVMQSGATTMPYTISPDGIIIPDNKLSLDVLTKKLSGSSDDPDDMSILGQTYTDMFTEAFRYNYDANLGLNLDLSQRFNGQSLPSGVGEPKDLFQKQLKQIYKAIQWNHDHQSDSLANSRQVFFVLIGGWDHHFDLTVDHPKKLGALDSGLHYFNQLMTKSGLSSDVTLFTASDFGRTLSPNSNTVGTDHAWGGNQIVMGGPVKGGQVFGNYPNFKDDDRDIGDGRFIPAVATDQYFGELAMWFTEGTNVSATDIFERLPDFGGASTSSPPVGFIY